MISWRSAVRSMGSSVLCRRAGLGSTGSRGDRRGLAGHAAVALQNAQLFEHQRRGAERQALLEHISQHLQSTLDIDTLIPLVLHEVNKAIEAEAQSTSRPHTFASIRVVVTVLFAVIIILLCCTIFIFPQHQQFAISLLFTPFGCLGRYRLQV